MKALQADTPEKKFVPYCYISKAADALTAYFEADPDYSERLNEHVTLYRSLDNHEVVGCRIKGISGIIEDLPNYIQVDDGNIRLSAVFLPFRGSVEDEASRRSLNTLAKTAGERGLVLETC
ncbi:MAG: hypothetical protein DWQ31_17735 [Planctomycetota bacterium]|nr:MAG: hypothetical protein DWQ31_17735 [Planctomycetota bacterium]REJ96816.1 MAG: hypothetical protein DWQ35_03375 [Planctomycetota bacterium]